MKGIITILIMVCVLIGTQTFAQGNPNKVKGNNKSKEKELPLSPNGEENVSKKEKKSEPISDDKKKKKKVKKN